MGSEQIRCKYCGSLFTPGRTWQIQCGLEKCRKARRLENQRRYRSTPEGKAKHREDAKRHYAIAKNKGTRRKIKKRYCRSPEAKAKRREKERLRRQSPEAKARHREKCKHYRRKETPDAKARRRENQRRYRSTPEGKAKCYEKVKRWRARRRLAKANRLFFARVIQYVQELANAEPSTAPAHESRHDHGQTDGAEGEIAG